jgi:hypothetical protein
MPTPPKDYSGLKMNYLTVVKRVADHIRPSGNRVIRWLCRCVCGKTVEKDAQDIAKWIKTGSRCKSCGCKKNEVLSKHFTLHGHTRANKGKPTREYYTFKAMHDRCYNENNDSYPNYGGRGIEVCNRWQKCNNGFKNFLQDMGPKPKGLTLERINTNGSYEPGNCKWATPKEQLNNTRLTIILEFNGLRLPLTSWAELLKVKEDTLRCRSIANWSDYRILATPIGEKLPKFYFHPHLTKLRHIVKEAAS